MTLPVALPDKASFEIAGTHLNAAYTHPMLRRSARAVRGYLDARLANGVVDAATMMADRIHAKAAFARLINADADEIAWVPSTMAGENFVVSALGLREGGGRVVSDVFHFEPSLYLYGDLARRGLSLEIVPARGHRIALDDVAAAITPGTRLVAVSLVSALNGFQHDLAALCAIAHERGALVYADIVQAAGAVPIDVRASGVDFCACATYKWLLGDFGAAFLYVRRDRLEHLQRAQHGYRQLADWATHFMPHDAPGRNPVTWLERGDAASLFEVGTLGNAAVAALRPGLDYLDALGIERIQAHRRPLMARLHEGLAARGFQPLTDPESDSPIASFALEGAADRHAARVAAAGVNVQFYPHRLRVSPSVHNDLDDIERLLAALA
jgi:selenocysteine lyase/cysteine desulfurase